MFWISTQTIDEGETQAFFDITTYITEEDGDPVTYTSETLFLKDLAALGHTVIHEGFEDEVWENSRSTISGGSQTASNISHNGVTWTSNNNTSQITTGNGAARMGEWGIYSLPHGSYTNPDPGRNPNNPGECGDGLRGSANNGVLYGIGGWFETNTPFAEMGLFIGVYPNNRVDLGETCDADGENCVDNAIIGTKSKFFGVIDSAGFTKFEFRELEGTIEDAKFIFADDFYFAGPSIANPTQPPYWLIR